MNASKSMTGVLEEAEDGSISAVADALEGDDQQAVNEIMVYFLLFSCLVRSDWAVIAGMIGY